MHANGFAISAKEKKSRRLLLLKRSVPLYLLILPSLILLIVFTYIPMYGVTIAFKDYKTGLGIFGSEWVGFKNFTTFFNSYQFWPILRNTLVISIYSIVVMFPLPILVALICSQITSSRYKKFFQVTTYLPHFISTVVMCGMIMLFLSPSSGIIAKLLSFVGIDMPNLMGSASAFPHIYVWTEAWQHIGWDSILYIAALSSIDPTLYEAATIDGANKWHKIFHIDIPSLLPTIMIMLILRMGSVMSVGFEKVYLLQNSLNNATSEIIATYVYKMGLLKSQYSLSAAIGLFNNVINLMKTILLVPLRDYYQSRKRIWVKYLIPVVLGLLALAGALIFNIGNEETIRSTFSEFVNVQINVVAILVSFSVAIISILVTADNANTKSLKEEMADSTQYKPVGGKQLSLFQILLSNIAYNVIVEIIYLVILIGIALIRPIIPLQALKYVAAVCIFAIMHILGVLLESVAQMYLTFWRNR